MKEIKFGTDGWRAIIADDFTVENLKRVAAATARWLKKAQPNRLSAVVGYDCRFGGKMFSEITAQVLCNHGIKAILASDFISTPMVSLASKVYDTGCGIIITASHNPPSYNGFKIKGNYGGPAVPAIISAVEALIPDTNNESLESIDALLKKGMVEYRDMETLYVEHAEKSFDMDAIRKSGLRIGYDAMYGAGQRAAMRLLPDADLLHCEHNPTFYGQAPEPIMKNLKPFAELIKTKGNIDIGFATDGDADRIGLYNSKGAFVDSHHIILLLIHYLVKYKGIKGKVVTAFSTTSRIKTLCQHYGLEMETVKIGFKYICAIMVREDVLLGGEESGGIAIKGHIPERDGIWMGLTLWEFMSKTGKSLEALIDEVYAITGSFHFDRLDLHISETQKQSVLQRCEQDTIQAFGRYSILKRETLDGYKYFISETSWIMIRASGTEPILRIYAEGSNESEVSQLLEAARHTLLN